jgi:hypothetical protein
MHGGAHAAARQCQLHVMMVNMAVACNRANWRCIHHAESLVKLQLCLSLVCAPMLMSTCSSYGCCNSCANNYVPRSVFRRCTINNNSAPDVQKQSFVVTLRCLELREHAAIARTYASLLIKVTNPTRRTLRKRIRSNIVETCPCTHSGTKVLTSHGHRQNGRCF